MNCECIHYLWQSVPKAFSTALDFDILSRNILKDDNAALQAVKTC